MKHYLILLMLAALAVPVFADEKNDSVPVAELDEVVVQGRSQRVIKYGVEYTPDKKMKKSAIDAIQLLQMMSIPQISVTPGTTDVKTVTGKGVAIYIDYNAATQQDVDGLRPDDVLRVEVLQYPEDPRFDSNANVINFIMRKYEWGGYTSVKAEGQTLGADMLGGNIYSKFVYKKMTFDASVQGKINYDDHVESYHKEIYRDFYYNGKHIDELTRISTMGDGYVDKWNDQRVSFRARYNSVNTNFMHEVSFRRFDRPLKRMSEDVMFSSDLLPSTHSLSEENSRSLYPYISGYYYFKLPKNNVLSARWSFSYGDTHRNSDYRLGDMDPIVNINKEKVYSPIVSVTYSKNFKHNNTFRTALMTFNSIYNTRYGGSYNDVQDLLSSENMLFLEYMQNWKFGLSLYSRIGMSYVIGRVNGVTELEQWNPRLGAQLQYQINDKHSASLEGWWGNSHPTPAQYNSALVQSNELLWLQGNPDLKNTIFNAASASYTFVPDNRWSFSANLEYEANPDKQAYEYNIIPGYNGLVRRSINSGDFNRYTAYVSASVKLLNNSLTLRATGVASRAVWTGIDRQSHNQLSGWVQAWYFIKNFGFSAYYSSPNSIFDAWNNGIYLRYKSTYGITANYSAGDFQVSLSYRNWFDRNFLYSDYDSPHYSSTGWDTSVNMTRSLSLTVKYTIPYGRKVNRDSDFEVSGGTGSAILK